jgi:hypothetical protein
MRALVRTSRYCLVSAHAHLLNADDLPPDSIPPVRGYLSRCMPGSLVVQSGGNKLRLMSIKDLKLNRNCRLYAG